MKLTEDEIADVEKLLSNFEKGARAGRRHWWPPLIGGMVAMGAAVTCLCLSFHLLNLRTTHQWVWQDPPSGWEIESYVKVQNAITGGWLVTYGMGIFALCVGMHVLTKTLQARYGGTRRLLIARILRAKWDEEKAAMKTASSAPGEGLPAP